MSSNIWTRCAGKSELRRLAAEPWRAVEAQHVISTRKLVDSDEEQKLLEELIDGAKPALPAGEEFEGLHFLLATPFRYPPLPHGSRFGSRAARALWYGSDSVAATLAEKAYYQLFLLEGTRAALEPITTPLTLFRARVETRNGVDLTRPPFSAYAAQLASKTDYAASQALGEAMRADGVEALRYTSARDPGGGTNVALFTPRAFASKAPLRPGQTWYCVAGKVRVELTRADLVGGSESLRFERALFEVGGKLPAPAA